LGRVDDAVALEMLRSRDENTHQNCALATAQSKPFESSIAPQQSSNASPNCCKVRVSRCESSLTFWE
jgi:hypothetical protein